MSICPMVEESEGLEAENVTDYSKKLRELLPDTIKVECLHGRGTKSKSEKSNHGSFL